LQGDRFREPAGRARGRGADDGLVSAPGGGRGCALAVPGADRRLRSAPMSLCRFCRAPLTRTFLDLGLQPLANSYLTPEQLAAGGEPVFPLRTMVCDRCFLVQADHDVPAEAIFDEGYAY